MTAAPLQARKRPSTGSSAIQAEPRPLRARDVDLMLASPSASLVRGDGWIHEPKLDGFRLRVGLEDGRPVLLYRRGSDVTVRFPEVAEAVRALPFRDLVLDGELVCHDASGLPSFERLMQRAHGRVDHSERTPAAFYAFDVLAVANRDLRRLPLVERKALLTEILAGAEAPLHRVDHVCGPPDALLAAVTQLGLEGLVSKRADGGYRGGRSSDWRKHCLYSHDLFAVVGLSPDGTAVHVAAQTAQGSLRYAGRIEWGFSKSLLAGAAQALERLARQGPACSAAPTGEIRWLTRAVHCRVRYKTWAPAGTLRMPMFLGFEAVCAESRLAVSR